MDNNPEHSPSQGGYFAIPALMVLPRAHGQFEVYLKQDGRMVLYTNAQDGFTAEHRQRLFEHGVSQLFVPAQHRQAYLDYVETNLGRILGDESRPLEERAEAFTQTSNAVIKDAMDSRLPGGLGKRQYRRIKALAANAVDFMSRPESFRPVARLVSHDYKTYSHSVQVMIYALALLQDSSYGAGDLRRIALGAALHDIGKTRVPGHVLNKKGRLNPDEWHLIQKHPALGVAVLGNVELEGLALKCIMFHHEKMNGNGYPTGISQEEIPEAVRALTLADVYDALTSHRSYSRAVSPFQALKIMRDEMDGSFDTRLYKRLVMVLSGAGIVNKV